MVGRKTADLVDARAAGGQRRPIVGLADAERGDDANAGDGDDRPSEMIGRFDHGIIAFCLLLDRDAARKPVRAFHWRGPFRRSWSSRLHQCSTFVAVETYGGGEHRIRLAGEFLFDVRVEGRIAAARPDCQCGKRDGEGKLRFLEVAGERREAANGAAARAVERFALCPGGIVRAGRAGDRQRALAGGISGSRSAWRGASEAVAAPGIAGRDLGELGIGRWRRAFRHARAIPARGRRRPIRSMTPPPSEPSRSHSGRQAPRCR